MLGSEGECKGSHAAVTASGCEAPIGKGHEGPYASTSAKSSLLLLQLSQPEYRPPCPLWQPRVKDTKVTLPFCHSKGVPPRSTLPYLPPHYLAIMRSRREAWSKLSATSKQFEFFKNTMQHISRQINLRIYKKGCIREKKISVPSRMVTLSITV